MADNARTPVAVRIVRPYPTEEAFLESELETVGKTSVILIGAHSRPTGVILRFEVTLSTGVTILRGEGRVLAHKENAFRGQPGLALRFTRLDPKSKALVDRAAAIREARLAIDAPRSGSIPPPAASTPSGPPSNAATPSVRPASATPSVRPASATPSVRPASATPSVRPASATPSVRPTPSAPPVASGSGFPNSLATSAQWRRTPPPSVQRTRSSAPPPVAASDPVLEHILSAPTPPPPPPTGFEARSMIDGRLSTDAHDLSPSRTSRPPQARSEAPSAEGAQTDAPRPDVSTLATEAANTEPPSESRSESIAPLPTSGSLRPISPPAHRDELLSKLRQRAANLTDEQKASILRTR